MFNNIDRESFDIAVSSKEEVIEVLESKVAWLERELDVQRKRADLAVDRLLAAYKCPTVMPENIVFPKPQEAADISRQEKEMELMRSELESIGEISEGEESKVTSEEIQ